MIREIVELGHPALRAAVGDVAWPLGDEDRGLAGDLLETMLGANGVGIAAPQVGSSTAMFIVASRPNPRYPDAPSMDPLIVINPEIVERSGELVFGWEGCLSIPGLRGLVPEGSSDRRAVPDDRRAKSGRARVPRWLRRPGLPARGRPPPRPGLPRPAGGAVRDLADGEGVLWPGSRRLARIGPEGGSDQRSSIPASARSSRRTRRASATWRVGRISKDEDHPGRLPTGGSCT